MSRKSLLTPIVALLLTLGIALHVMLPVSVPAASTAQVQATEEDDPSQITPTIEPEEDEQDVPVGTNYPAPNQAQTPTANSGYPAPTTGVPNGTTAVPQTTATTPPQAATMVATQQTTATVIPAFPRPGNGTPLPTATVPVQLPSAPAPTPSDTPIPTPTGDLTCAPGVPVLIEATGPPLSGYLILFNQRIVGGGTVDGDGNVRAKLVVGNERPGVYPVVVQQRDTKAPLRELLCTVPFAPTPTVTPSR